MNQDIYVIVEHLRKQVVDISYVMLAAAQELAQGTDGNVVAVLLGHKVPELADDLAADRVLYVDHPALADFTSDAYERALAHIIEQNAPRAVLFGDTSIGAEVANLLSARLAIPLISSCRSVTADGLCVSQICGGKIMVESKLSGPTTLITMIPGGFKPEQGKSNELPEVSSVEAPSLDGLRLKLMRYIEPEAGDVDISKAQVLVAVGRGLQNRDDLEVVQELADALGGVVCASRPVVDQGWLPTTRMVGRSGRRVKPKLYLAMGISGAPEHVEAITDSQAIIAVNTDPAAPIFDVAQYGATVDMFDLLPVLTEQVKQAKAKGR